MQKNEQKRWPDHIGWDELDHAMVTLAKSCGSSALCSQKYDYLNVELTAQGASPAQKKALITLAELIEQVSDTEDHGTQSTVHWVRGVIAQKPITDTPTPTPASIDDFTLGQSNELQFRLIETAFASGDEEAFDQALNHIESVRRMKRNGTLDWQAPDDVDTL
jgi:hypothetical protein